MVDVSAEVLPYIHGCSLVTGYTYVTITDSYCFCYPLQLFLSLFHHHISATIRLARCVEKRVCLYCSFIRFIFGCLNGPLFLFGSCPLWSIWHLESHMLDVPQELVETQNRVKRVNSYWMCKKAHIYKGDYRVAGVVTRGGCCRDKVHTNCWFVINFIFII